MRHRIIQIFYHMLEGNDQNSSTFNQIKELMNSGLLYKNIIWQHKSHTTIDKLNLYTLDFFSNNKMILNAKNCK